MSYGRDREERERRQRLIAWIAIAAMGLTAIGTLMIIWLG